MTETKPAEWIEEVRTLSPQAKELFETYSNIPSTNIKSHIKKFRDEAFKIHAYPCLATFAFLDLVVTSSPQYSEILQRIQNGDKYLDIGCCVGQDIRKLVHDGAPSENTYGSDLQKAFLDMGYDLFLDKSSLKTTLIAADIFDSDSDLNQLDGKIDVIHAALFLHLFDLERCTDAVRRIVKLFKDKPDCLFIGKQLGCVESGPLRDKFRHDDKSFVAMWEKIAEETGTKWDIDARLEDEDLYLRAEKMGLRVRFLPEGSRVLSFSVRRVG